MGFCLFKKVEKKIKTKKRRLLYRYGSTWRKDGRMKKGDRPWKRAFEPCRVAGIVQHSFEGFRTMSKEKTTSALDVAKVYVIKFLWEFF